MLSVVLMLLAVFSDSALSVVSYTQVPCNKSETKDTGCSFCIAVTYKRRPRRTRPLKTYMDSLETLISGGSYGNFSWTLPPKSGMDPKHVTITFFTWSGSESYKGPPIKGCCGIPLNKGSCQATECGDGEVYFGLSSGNTQDANSYPLLDNKKPIKPTKCAGTTPPKGRFVYSCPSHLPQWMSSANVTCLRYNLDTGAIEPADKTKFESVSRDHYLEDRRIMMAQEFTSMCSFLLPKDRVYQEKKRTVMSKTFNDEVLFNREVQQMTSLQWNGRLVFDSQRNHSIQCSMKLIVNYTEVMKIRHVNHDRKMYLCVVLLPVSANQQSGNDANYVKCMPQNETTADKTPKPPVTPNKNYLVVILVVSCIGGIILVFLGVLLCLTVKRNVGKFAIKTEVVPKHLNHLMKDDVEVFGSKEMEAEVFDALSPEPPSRRASLEI